MNERLRGLKLSTSPFILWSMVGGFYLLAFAISPDIQLFSPIFPLKSFLVLVPVLGTWLFWCLIANQEKFKSAENISKLIITGPYAIVRHPIYFADLLGLLYPVLVHPQLWVAIGGIMSVPIVLWWARKEESVLRLKFGQAYEDYASKTSGFNPVYSLLAHPHASPDLRSGP